MKRTASTEGHGKWKRPRRHTSFILLPAPYYDHERVVREWPLQPERLFGGSGHPKVNLLARRQNDGHCLRVDYADCLVRLSGEKREEFIGCLACLYLAHRGPACLYPDPFPHAHVVTTTTYKSLHGARGGLALWNDEALSDRINHGIFPACRDQ